MAQVKSINSSEFEFETNQGFVLVDFWAPWCSNCRMLAPVFEQLSETFDKKVKFLKVNVDENENLAIKYDIQTLPVLILFKDGKEIDRSIGFKLKVALEKWINAKCELN